MAGHVEIDQIELNNHDQSTKILDTLPHKFKQLQLEQKLQC